MSRAELKTYVYDLMCKCTKGVTPGGLLQIDYEVHFAVNKPPTRLCSTAFYALHLRGHSFFDGLKLKIKDNQFGTEKKFSDRSTIAPDLVKKLILKGGSFGIKLTPDQITASTLPNTVLSLACASWMKEHFKLIGTITRIIREK